MRDEVSTLTSLDTGVTQYRYDASGNLSRSTDARNQRALYAYDAGNRLTQVRHGVAQGDIGIGTVEEPGSP